MGDTPVKEIVHHEAETMQKSLLRSRVFLVVMIACGCWDFVSGVRYPSARFHVPGHLPFEYLLFLSARANIAVGVCVELGILLVCVSLVSDASTVAGRLFWVVITGDIFLPTFRYALPSIAASLWWTGMLADVFVIVGACFFLATAGRRAAKAMP
jgi:hypothetical protein